MEEFDIEIADGVSSLSSSAWNELVGPQSPFLEYGFLHSLEVSGCLDPDSGWHPRIITARRDGDLIGAVPLYLKDHSSGEFVFDWSWADGAQRTGIAYYPKGVVAVPFTPVTGARILTSPDCADRQALGSALVEKTLNAADDMDLSSVHFNFIDRGERHYFRDLGLPIRLGIQYHWYNDDGSEQAAPYGDFDDFLARFRSKKRSNIRRERRKLRERGATTRVLRGDQLDDDDMRRIFRYYLDTVHKHLYGRQYLNESFFLHLRKALEDRLHVVFCDLDGTPFAGALNLMKSDRLYGRYWGCEREIKFAHFETCIYRPVQWCIEQGVEVFEPGAGGEHKLTRGFEPTLTYSAHYIRDAGLRRAVEDFIRRERHHIEREVQRLRDDSPFKN